MFSASPLVSLKKEHTMSYIKTLTDLRIYALNAEQMAKTCGPYPFVCRSDKGCTAYTAFLSGADMAEWLRVRGLTLDGDAVVGEFREAMHMSYDEFYANDGERIRVMSNGDYTLGIVTTDADGLRTVHSLNPNCHDRPVYDHQDSRALQKLGEHSAPARRKW